MKQDKVQAVSQGFEVDNQELSQTPIIIRLFQSTLQRTLFSAHSLSNKEKPLLGIEDY